MIHDLLKTIGLLLKTLLVLVGTIILLLLVMVAYPSGVCGAHQRP
jgi:hypothetical protein